MPEMIWCISLKESSINRIIHAYLQYHIIFHTLTDSKIKKLFFIAYHFSSSPFLLSTGNSVHISIFEHILLKKRHKGGIWYGICYIQQKIKTDRKGGIH